MRVSRLGLIWSPWLVCSGVPVGCAWAPYLYSGVYIIVKITLFDYD